MAAKVFGWLGASRRQSLLSKLIPVTQSWWDEWAIDATNVQRAEATDEVGTGEGTYFCFEARGRYALHLEGDLVTALTGLAAAEGGELSTHLFQSAIADLIRRLENSRTTAMPALVQTPNLPDELTESRWGGCHLVLMCGSVRLSLWLDRHAVDRWVPRASSQPTELVDRLEAAAPATTHLSASLDLGDISLEELQGLVPGDVIATSAPLTRPIDVAMAHGPRHLFHGQLGERDGYRALRLLSPEVLESTQ